MVELGLLCRVLKPQNVICFTQWHSVPEGKVTQPLPCIALHTCVCMLQSLFQAPLGYQLLNEKPAAESIRDQDNDYEAYGAMPYLNVPRA